MLRTGLVAGVKPRDRFLGIFTRGEAQLAMTQLTCATYRADQASSAWSVMVDTLTTIEGESRRSRAFPATNHKPPGGSPPVRGARRSNVANQFSFYRRDPARPVQSTIDLGLPNLDAPLPPIVYLHLDWCCECTPTPMQQPCAQRPDADSAKRCGGGCDRGAAGLHNSSRYTGLRSQGSLKLERIAVGEAAVTRYGRLENRWQGDRLIAAPRGRSGRRPSRSFGCGGWTAASGRRPVVGRRIIARTNTGRNASACVADIAAGTNANAD
jgi:hypothetical protein